MVLARLKPRAPFRSAKASRSFCLFRRSPPATHSPSPHRGLFFLSLRFFSLEERFDVLVAGVSRVHPRGALEMIDGVHVGAALEQHTHDVGEAGGGGTNERRSSVGVPDVD